MTDRFPRQTLPQLIRAVLAEPRAETLVERVNGKWTPTSSHALLERAENLACAIRDAGLEAGDRVALISRNCVDWVVTAFGALFAGCVVVPIYPTQALDQTSYILHHSGAKLVLVDTPQALDRLRDVPDLPRAIVFESDEERSLRSFEVHGAHVRFADSEAIRRYESAIGPDDLAVLIYTSGTTGDPKGVMLTHDNITFDARSSFEYGFQAIKAGDDVISVLPYSHIYEHTIIYIHLLGKLRYSICHDPNELIADLQDVRPVSMTAVPRIFDRVVAGVTSTAIAHGGLQAKLVPWALRIGRDYMKTKTSGSYPSIVHALQYAVAKRLVATRICKRLGIERIRYFTSGSAALHIDTAMTFLGLGIPIMQGYGLTETSPVISVSALSANRYGAVGKPIPGVDVKIAGDGEILTRGRHVMKGYYRDDVATAQAIVNGWFHTGDIGKFDTDGYLYITDRKKEVFKTAGGKFIAPARVESAIKRSIFVTQAVIVGAGQSHPIALICANWELVRATLGIPANLPPDELPDRPDVRTFLTREVEQRTSDLAGFEQVRRIVILPRDFTVESGELSPSMKVKRRVVEQRYARQIEAAFSTERSL